MLIHPCCTLYGVIIGTKKYEDKYNFLFLLGAGISDWTSNSSVLIFYEFINAHDIALIK